MKNKWINFVIVATMLVANGCATTLHRAAAKGDLDNVHLLITQNKQKIDMIKMGNTPLMLASKNGHKDVAISLIEAGADVNVNSNGWTALHRSALNGHLQIQRLLIQHGADVNATSWSGITPLMYAARSATSEIIEFMVERGANVNLDAVSQNVEWIKWCSGNTALHEAAEHNNTDVAGILITAGAEVNHLNRRGQTPLYLAIASNGMKTATCLLQAGGKIQTLSETPDDLYVTAHSHRLTAIWHEETRKISSGIDHYRKAAHMFEQAEPRLMEQSRKYGKEKKVWKMVAGMEQTARTMRLAAALKGKRSYAPQVQSHSNESAATKAVKFAVLEKEFLEKAQDSGTRAAECRAALKKLSTAKRLEELKDLKESGILTEQEYESKRKQLIEQR